MTIFSLQRAFLHVCRRRQKHHGGSEQCYHSEEEQQKLFRDPPGSHTPQERAGHGSHGSDADELPVHPSVAPVGSTTNMVAQKTW